MENNVNEEVKDEILEESAEEQNAAEQKKTDKKKSEKSSKYKKELEAAKKELKEATDKKEEYYNDYLRARADYENLKRRSELSNSQHYTDGISKAVLEILPVIDNLERALEAEKEDTSIKKGVEMVLRQAKASFEKLGISEIEAEGKPFDPNVHNAVMQVAPEEGEESGVVKTVLLKGYKLGDKVIRHSMVQVTE